MKMTRLKNIKHRLILSARKLPPCVMTIKGWNKRLLSRETRLNSWKTECRLTRRLIMILTLVSYTGNYSIWSLSVTCSLVCPQDRRITLSIWNWIMRICERNSRSTRIVRGATRNTLNSLPERLRNLRIKTMEYHTKGDWRVRAGSAWVKGVGRGWTRTRIQTLTRISTERRPLTRKQ